MKSAVSLVQKGRPSRRPEAGWPDARRLLAAGLALLLVACGARDDASAPPSAPRATGVAALPPGQAADARDFARKLALAGRPDRRIAAVLPGVDDETLLDWAQWQFPALFPAGARTVHVDHLGVTYAVRVYPTGNYLGVTRQGQVYGLGPFTGGQLQGFGAATDYAARVRADRCLVYPAACAPATPLDDALRALIAREGLTGDPRVGRNLPHIADAMPQLGRLLFFSKSLSMDRDTACASCHHPTLAGGDGLGISIGSGAADPDLVGPGRRDAQSRLLVSRNANTFFNVALYDRALFADGRVQTLAPSEGVRPGGAGTPIRTPDSAGLAADPAAGPNLLAAQARFPITGPAEMRGERQPGLSDAQVREHIASRLASEAAASPADRGWLPHFRRAFSRPQGTAAELITFDNIMIALAEYQRSAVFVKSPWQRYVLGENGALTDEAKHGAIRFFSRLDEGGAACAQCHKGDFFTDERFHVIGFPQAGPGFAAGGVDRGREQVSGDRSDRMAFRTPSLLNVGMTAPYGHAGTYDSLFAVNRHYALPELAIREFVNNREWCAFTPGFAEWAGCQANVADATRESQASLREMQARRAAGHPDAMPDIFPTASENNSFRVIAFMEALTDPCLRDRACLDPWIPRPEEAPDAHQLNARDREGRLR